MYDQLFDTYLENKKNGGTRLDFLKKACQIPGIYVPQFYEVTYHEDGTVAAFTPSIPEAPEKIKKQLVMDMTEATYPEKPVVPFIKATQDRVVLEIQRGCIRGCRFCQAGFLISCTLLMTSRENASIRRDGREILTPFSGQLSIR